VGLGGAVVIGFVLGTCPLFRQSPLIAAIGEMVAEGMQLPLEMVGLTLLALTGESVRISAEGAAIPAGCSLMAAAVAVVAGMSLRPTRWWRFLVLWVAAAGALVSLMPFWILAGPESPRVSSSAPGNGMLHVVAGGAETVRQEPLVVASTPQPAPTSTPPIAPVSRIGKCEAIRGTAYESVEERTWFLANCVSKAAATAPPPRTTAAAPEAVDFVWYQGTPNDSISRCNTAWPVPPNSPLSTNLCTRYRFRNMPAGVRTISYVVKVDGFVLHRPTFQRTFSESSFVYEAEFGIPAGRLGRYELEVWVDGKFAGLGSVLVSR
jgi:hypothetical protein